MSAVLKRLASLQSVWILGVLVVIVVLFSLAAGGKFLSAGNFSLISQNIAVWAVLGVGMTFVIITAGHAKLAHRRLHPPAPAVRRVLHPHAHRRGAVARITNDIGGMESVVTSTATSIAANLTTDRTIRLLDLQIRRG